MRAAVCNWPKQSWNQSEHIRVGSTLLLIYSSSHSLPSSLATTASLCQLTKLCLFASHRQSMVKSEQVSPSVHQELSSSPSTTSNVRIWSCPCLTGPNAVRVLKAFGVLDEVIQHSDEDGLTMKTFDYIYGTGNCDHIYHVRCSISTTSIYFVIPAEGLSSCVCSR